MVIDHAQHGSFRLHCVIVCNCMWRKILYKHKPLPSSEFEHCRDIYTKHVIWCFTSMHERLLLYVNSSMHVWMVCVCALLDNVTRMQREDVAKSESVHTRLFYVHEAVKNKPRPQHNGGRLNCAAALRCGSLALSTSQRLRLQNCC